MQIEPLPPVPLLKWRLSIRKRLLRFSAWAFLVLAAIAIGFAATDTLLDQSPTKFIQAKN